MKIAMILSLIVALGLAGTTWYYHGSTGTMTAERDSLLNVRDEQAVRIANLEREKADISGRLEEQIARLSKEKEQELDRLRSTYDTLVTDLKSEIEQGQVTITKLADRLSVSMIDKILFPSGESEITTDGLKVLARVGNVLKNAQNKIVRVEGHTDNVPISTRLVDRYPTNWELSTARATNVARFLQEKVGIPPARLEAVGMSEFHPVASNSTPAGRGQNRRIEIALLPDVGTGE